MNAVCFIYGRSESMVEQINNSTGTVQYLHHDQAGSTRLLTGSTGTVTGKCTYAAYGAPTCEGTATTPLGWDAQYTSSDTGLIYMRARTYDPATAQFLSVDPAVATTGAPYNYAEDNPVNESDPTGLGDWLGLGIPSPGEAGSKAVHIGLDIVAVPPYLVYYASYYAAKEISGAGCTGSLGPIEPLTCLDSHLVASPLVVPEAVGLGGDVAIDAIKGESICDEGVEGYINPLHSFVRPSLRGPKVYLPGVHPGGSVDFEW